MGRHVLWLVVGAVLAVACGSGKGNTDVSATVSALPATPVAMSTLQQPIPTLTATPVVMPTHIATKSSGMIAYVGVAKDYNLFVVNLDGTGRVRLTNAYDAGSVHSVALSPDGHQILFVVGYGSTQIYAANTDGSGIRSLTEDEAGSDLPAWSPDGQTIAYTGYDSTGLDRIYLMNRDGSNKRLLTAGSGY